MFQEQKNREIAFSCAKGSWQREIVKKLLDGDRIPSPSMFLRGKAWSYSSKYERSLSNLYNRLDKTGVYETAFSPGPKGGYGRILYYIGD